KALEAFHKSCQIDPNDRRTIQNYFHILSNLTNIKNAKQILKLYITKHPDDIEMKEMLTNNFAAINGA
ncbi:MAG: hypothetical protein U9R20_05995, partial [Thermodesulfobacteriota bacterium]|nr:hypothetical protein [Thermodesulfobacteriota bacterium]